MQEIALLGSDGQVGQELRRLLSPLGSVHCFNRQSLDLARPEKIASVLEPLRPTIICNAAAYTAVDQAEVEPELAQQINAVAPTELARIAQRLNARLIHISTDYVFDGTRGIPYQPSDPTQPLGVYGQTKLAGEQGIQAACDRYWIIRTAWVYGTFGQRNFVKTMLRLGEIRTEIQVVADQIGAPTWAKSLAEAIASLIQSLDTETAAPTGIYHFTNSGVASWYDFATAIFEEAQALNLPLTIERILPVTSAHYPTPARRPNYSVLSCQEILPFLSQPPSHWRAALRQMLAEYQNSLGRMGRHG
jgi:dTDP-4-dehydrorhamnose reductase